MPRPADAAPSERQIVRDALNRAEILGLRAAVVHATVRIVPDEAPPLNLIVNESPTANVKADP